MRLHITSLRKVHAEGCRWPFSDATLTVMQRCTHGSETLLKASSGPLITRLRHVAVRHRAFSSQPGTTYDVAILGGGVTGLAAAYYLTKELPKARITIYEGSDRLGGWLSSKRIPVEGGSVLFESGPRSLRTSSNGILAARLVRFWRSKGSQ